MGPKIRGVPMFACSLVLISASGSTPERPKPRTPSAWRRVPMRWLSKRDPAPEQTPENPEPEPEPERAASIADQFFDSYLRWREACEDLRTAYHRWHYCDPPQRFLAFDGYQAALEREERAASVHSHLAERLRATTS